MMKWLKLVLLIKVLIFAGCMVALGLGLRFGERSLVAAPSPSPSPSPSPGAKVPREKKEEAVEEDTNARKSFLGDLLFLPEPPVDEAKKEEVVKYQMGLDRKKHQLDDRINLLKKREALLIELEKSIDAKLQKLDEEMAFFQQTQQKEKEVQKERLAQLIDFYKKMSPKQAAPVFEKLDKDMVVALWKEFPQKQTQAILALMNPDKAVELSEYFGRLRSAKEYDLLKEINMGLRKEFEDCRGMPPEVAKEPTP